MSAGKAWLARADFHSTSTKRANGARRCSSSRRVVSESVNMPPSLACRRVRMMGRWTWGRHCSSCDHGSRQPSARTSTASVCGCSFFTRRSNSVAVRAKMLSITQVFPANDGDVGLAITVLPALAARPLGSRPTASPWPPRRRWWPGPAREKAPLVRGRTGGWLEAANGAHRRRPARWGR